jgi:hypothetical protein
LGEQISIVPSASAPSSPPPSAPRPTTTPPPPTTTHALRPGGALRPLLLPAAAYDDDGETLPPPESVAVTINTTLSEANTRRLFAWIKCAFDHDGSDGNDAYAYYYNNIELAIAAAFGNNLPRDSLPGKLLEMAMKREGLTTAGVEDDRWGGSGASDGEGGEWEERPIGDPIGRRDRESASLGAMGAAQWSGRWMTRPHCEFCTRS